jgi:hypothetical protein
MYLTNNRSILQFFTPIRQLSSLWHSPVFPCFLSLPSHQHVHKSTSMSSCSNARHLSCSYFFMHFRSNVGIVQMLFILFLISWLQFSFLFFQLFFIRKLRTSVLLVISTVSLIDEISNNGLCCVLDVSLLTYQTFLE